MKNSISVDEYRQLLAKSDTNTTKSKYRNSRVVVNNKSFDSRSEASYYLFLLGELINGSIRMFLRQVPFDLSESTKQIYKCDFLVVNNDNSISVIDVKGFETKGFKLKAPLIESRYNIKIQLVKKVKNFLKNIPIDPDSGSYNCSKMSEFLKYRIRSFDCLIED
ncbi:MAG: DUF1064 domain-containing protein [Pseudomonadota bacterium]